MKQQIAISYRLTLDEAQQAQSCHFRQFAPRWSRMGLWLFSNLLAVAGVYVLVHDHDSQGYIFVLMGLYYPLLWPLERRWKIRRIFSKNPRDSEVKWDISEDVLRLTDTDINAELKWSGITKAVQAPFGVLLYISKTMFHIFPRRVFGTEDEFAAFVEIVKSRVPRFRQIR
jgi:hypothetical protein